MQLLSPRSTSVLKECTALAALGVILAIAMPVLGVFVLLFRGAVVAAAGIVLAAIVAVWAWHLVSPTRKPFRPAAKH